MKDRGENGGGGLFCHFDKAIDLSEGVGVSKGKTRPGREADVVINYCYQ